MSEVRVRFGPSPTGELHVGGLRTALYNYLFAKKSGGKFILRIEDTDRTRHVEDADRRLLEMLHWAGVDPDEGPQIGGDCGPYHQSERLPLYHEAARKLMESGHAYKCFCSSETLDEMRKQQQSRGQPTKYDGRCRKLTPEDHAKLEAQGQKAVVRMRIPDRDERIVIKDLIRGNVAFNTSQVDDQVLLKSDDFPTYHLAVVVDDHAMGITHVLRAEEWLSSTPKHELLYQWLGYQPPQWAHLPLLLNEDRSKMSKRKGDVTVEAFKAKGYLPEALVNFVALLGWSAGDDQEFFTLQELAEKFSIERIGKTGAVFNREKLAWMNQIYISKLDGEGLFNHLKPYIDQTPHGGQDEATLRKICLLVQPQLVTLGEIQNHLDVFFLPDDAPLGPEEQEKMADGEAPKAFKALHDALLAMDGLDADSFKEVVKKVQQETGVKGKHLWGPLRVALTRSSQGPELPYMAAILGRQKLIRRLEMALKG